jgi:hypothetical protein
VHRVSDHAVGTGVDDVESTAAAMKGGLEAKVRDGEFGYRRGLRRYERGSRVHVCGRLGNGG